MSEVEQQQREICRRYGAGFLETLPFMKLGIGRDLRLDVLPLNGLRHPPESGTSGWFIWSGERFPADPGSFAPVHVTHLQDRLPAVLPYLGLAPGWRFLLAGTYEDVWFDAALLKISRAVATSVRLIPAAAPHSRKGVDSLRDAAR